MYAVRTLTLLSSPSPPSPSRYTQCQVNTQSHMSTGASTKWKINSFNQSNDKSSCPCRPNLHDGGPTGSPHDQYLPAARPAGQLGRTLSACVGKEWTGTTRQVIAHPNHYQRRFDTNHGRPTRLTLQIQKGYQAPTWKEQTQGRQIRAW